MDDTMRATQPGPVMGEPMRATVAEQPRDVGKVTALANRIADQTHRLHELLDGVDARLAPVLREPQLYPSEPRDQESCSMAESLRDISDRLGGAMTRLESILERSEL